MKKNFNKAIAINLSSTTAKPLISFFSSFRTLFFVVFLCMMSGAMANNTFPILNDQRIEYILNFWFDYTNHPEILYDRTVWWKKDGAFDASIQEQFASLRKEAIEGKLTDWLKTPKGSLAYIILIDQFSRNIYRGSAQMYQHDNLALQAAIAGINQKFDTKLSLTERIFFYMPLEHSENLSDQQLSVKMFKQLLNETPLEYKPRAQQYLKFAEDHYQVIKQFNRFVHRNDILGRSSTEKEIEFLKTHQGW